MTGKEYFDIILYTNMAAMIQPAGTENSRSRS